MAICVQNYGFFFDRHLLFLFFCELFTKLRTHSVYSPVWEVFDFVNSDHPMFCGVCLFHRRQLELFVANFGMSDPVISRVLATCKNQAQTHFFDRLCVFNADSKLWQKIFVLTFFLLIKLQRGLQVTDEKIKALPSCSSNG